METKMQAACLRDAGSQLLSALSSIAVGRYPKPQSNCPLKRHDATPIKFSQSSYTIMLSLKRLGVWAVRFERLLHHPDLLGVLEVLRVHGAGIGEIDLDTVDHDLASHGGFGRFVW